MPANEQKKEIRDVKFGCSLTKTEYSFLNKLSKKTKLSKTELIVKSLYNYEVTVDDKKNKP
jgi:hypothetical protein